MDALPWRPAAAADAADGVADPDDEAEPAEEPLPGDSSLGFPASCISFISFNISYNSSQLAEKIDLHIKLAKYIYIIYVAEKVGLF